MLKSLLLGLDGTEDSIPVMELGLRWAKRFDALAVGFAAVDRPRMIVAESAFYSGVVPWPATESSSPRSRQSVDRVDRMLEHLVRRGGEAGVACKTLADVGSPYVQLLRESQRFHLVLLSQAAQFDC